MLDNLRVAWILKDIGDLLKLKGANYFQIQSYYDVSKRIKNLDIDIRELAMNDKLQDIEGIGDGLASTINEVLDEGTCARYEELKNEIPIGLLEILDLPGIGPKKVKLFHDELGIENLEALKEAADNRKLRKLSGVGAKTEFKILDAIKKFKGKDQKVTLDLATTVSEELINICSRFKEVEKIEVVGGLRRKEELIDDIDLLVATNRSQPFMETVQKLPLVTEVIKKSEDRLKVGSKLGVDIDIFFVSNSNFSTTLVLATGNEGHYKQLSELAKAKNCELKEEAITSEEKVYKALDLPYIIPEIRTGDREIELAMNDDLPTVLKIEDIKGDLHMHTKWSDGGNTTYEMAVACQEKGYEYLAVCDHSRSLGIAGGLSLDDLRKQMVEVDRVNEKLENFQVLKGAEVDILYNGDLDYPIDILEELDIVVASIHSGFKQAEEQMTERILNALEHDEVNILAHPTGRLLGKRDGYAVDIKRVISKAVETDTILEINASPERLDLSSDNLRLAKEAGAKIAINTDAHNIQQLENMSFGVYNARKGWIEPKDVVNTYSLSELLAWIN
ncbi:MULTISPECIES: DNA polymerase/3'-5' exonuclease PolX [unclassified Candidatus Frackibacter]|uniref:DNA polymerase/3'-5' exonuclease PolX n=1 Tax=unclassified Candidatus Frackibacter TaxID=2648818 RepID=UPI00088C2568|nr:MULTISPECIES: DNA polymerase/3'-5' exonuclease PolX [unclassified Candidatus Frackibacter]SDC88655.1 DNA polymerase (family 10) [Candidatus Frackibacter sp. WG11]SEN02490.1 DNA polymerase (family 10) [Candidatus Frackibacter sp. WG12]SFM10516.1 DNA polymerase (family 10) [Candidatus Frackibacter sp. WG13]